MNFFELLDHRAHNLPVLKHPSRDHSPSSQRSPSAFSTGKVDKAAEKRWNESNLILPQRPLSAPSTPRGGVRVSKKQREYDFSRKIPAPSLASSPKALENSAERLGREFFTFGIKEDIECFLTTASEDKIDDVFQGFKNAFEEEQSKLHAFNHDETVSFYNNYIEKLSALVKLLPKNTTVLNLRGFSFLYSNPKDLFEILKSLDDLKILNLTGCHLGSAASALIATSKWNALEILNLSGCEGDFADSGFQLLGNYSQMPQLKTIHLRGSNADHRFIAAIREKLPQVLLSSHEIDTRKADKVRGSVFNFNSVDLVEEGKE